MNKPSECYLCNKHGALMCGRCGVARYCSANCQRLHWKFHKQVCSVDSDDGMRKVNFGGYDPECLHGAPNRSETDISEPTLALVMDFAVIEGPSDELVCLEEFCRKNPTVASDKRCPLIFMSMAADAMHEKNFAQCRKFLRAMHFLDAYVLEGEDFLTALHAQGSNAELDQGSPPSLRQFIEGMKATGSMRGVYHDISARAACRCFYI